jgi:hypothetical protein
MFSEVGSILVKDIDANKRVFWIMSIAVGKADADRAIPASATPARFLNHLLLPAKWCFVPGIWSGGVIP